MRLGSITKQNFKAKKMDLFYQTKLLCDFIENQMPELSKQANKFYCFNLTNLMSILIHTNKNEFRDEKRIIQKESMLALKRNIGNSFISFKDKIRMVLKIIQLN